MMMGTILRTLFDFGQLRVAQGIPQEIIRHVENAIPFQNYLPKMQATNLQLHTNTTLGGL
jgi:hypothetical protein